MEQLYLAIPLSALAGSVIAGFFGGKIGRVGAHSVTILGVAISCLLSLIAFKHLVFDGGEVFNGTVYTWMVADGINFEVGFLIDRLTVMMMCVVTSVSLAVHVYTIGYMADDAHNWPEESLAGRNSYQRFFSYISLFTFSMLMLVMSNNFLQLFFGWEAVGLVSYLLIGFWSVRPTAIYANLKAFLVNRVGDFGFLLGIAAILMYTGSLDYQQVFGQGERLSGLTMEIIPGQHWDVLSVACILLFIGAMGKSAQVPLHVWLPDSMEGPTPISALIHAATMVTAGIFMVARMSPLFEFSETALTFVLVIGSITALSMGLVGIVQNDIKRVIAYSTLSQLGYMTVALGVSAYSAAIFHLMTHAFFKALLFLAAGSVIIAMHHDQDIRNMGGLRKYMPITYWTSLIGSLALIGFPGFSGFFSKDAIIEAVGHSDIAGSGFAYFCVTAGVFITAFYSFRMFFLVFHGKERMDEHTRSHLHETPWVVWAPLVFLAVPSVIIGAVTVGPVLFGEYFQGSIVVHAEHDVLAELGSGFHGWLGMLWHGMLQPPFALAMGGVVTAWYLYLKNPTLATSCKNLFAPIYRLLDKKYYADEILVEGTSAKGRDLGNFLWKKGDVETIDGAIVNGSANAIGAFAKVLRGIQTGYLYHYAFAMIIGVLGLLTWFVAWS